LLADLVVLLLL